MTYRHPAAELGPWKDNPDYLEREARGDRWRRVVAARFSEEGFTVMVPHTKRQSRRDDPTDWNREIDLYVGLTWPVRFPGGVGMPWPVTVEVKSTDVVFTSPTDFPLKEFMLYKRAKEHPGVLVMVSDPGGALVGLFPQRASIYEGLGVDRKRDITYPVWKARREELLPFSDIVRRLKVEPGQGVEPR